MSHQQTSRSPDVRILLDEGFDIEFRGGYLLVRQVPYLNSQKAILRGILVCETSLDAGHTIHFSGEYPHDTNGHPLSNVVNSPCNNSMGGISVNFLLSSKPPNGYLSIHQKITNYINLLSAPAVAIDKNVTARTYRIVEITDPESPFKYEDTASTRAGIMCHAEKLKLERIAIVGLGGTGSYVLDLVAKSPVSEIHLIDGDKFLQHNAFRSPGAASREDLELARSKVSHFAEKYSAQKNGIVVHEQFLTEETLPLLDGMTSVFICIDNGEIKKKVIARLERTETTFIDVGMGIESGENGLFGVVRTTTSTADARNHVHEKKLIPFSDTGSGDYSRNIQVADLNALNAALAVIKWKKLLGYYHDDEREMHTLYSIRGNTIANRFGTSEP